MPYTPHILVAYGGTIRNTPEIWQNTMRFTSDDLSGAHCSAMLTRIAPIVQNWIQNSTMNFMAAVSLDFIKVNAVDANGHYTTNPTVEQIYQPGTYTGDSSSGYMPLQCSTVVSWGTNTRGASGRGRMYLPPQGSALSQDFRLTEATCQLFAQQAATYAQAMSDAADHATIFSIMSTKNGLASAVRNARVGRVIDTQRRRRGALVEDYQEVAW